MNYKQALEASECNPEGVNAVLERLEVGKCLECGGVGNVTMGPVNLTNFTTGCNICNGIGKLHYSWTPQVGEWVIDPENNIACIGSNKDLENLRLAMAVNPYFVSILDWQTIEEILEKAGYWMEVIKPLGKYIKAGTMAVSCSIYEDEGRAGCVAFVKAKTCQEAVMKAVIELGKEMK